MSPHRVTKLSSCRMRDLRVPESQSRNIGSSRLRGRDGPPLSSTTMGLHQRNRLLVVDVDSTGLSAEDMPPLHTAKRRTWTPFHATAFAMSRLLLLCVCALAGRADCRQVATAVTATVEGRLTTGTRASWVTNGVARLC